MRKINSNIIVHPTSEKINHCHTVQRISSDPRIPKPKRIKGHAHEKNRDQHNQAYARIIKSNPSHPQNHEKNIHKEKTRDQNY